MLIEAYNFSRKIPHCNKWSAYVTLLKPPKEVQRKAWEWRFIEYLVYLRNILAYIILLILTTTHEVGIIFITSFYKWENCSLRIQQLLNESWERSQRMTFKSNAVTFEAWLMGWKSGQIFICSLSKYCKTRTFFFGSFYLYLLAMFKALKLLWFYNKEKQNVKF